MQSFSLPPSIIELLTARDKLRNHYQAILEKKHSDVELHFTLDGNLVGDIGEAIAVELFDIRLVKAKSTEGFDGHAPDGRTVQIKATGKGRGPAFRLTKIRADHLLFFDLDFESGKGQVVFNGPERIAISKLPVNFSGQRSLTAKQIQAADKLVTDAERLPPTVFTAQ